MPIISIILSTYGKAQFILEAITSVMNQSFKDWELLIIGDPPIERETEEIINNYLQKDSRIK